MSDLDTKVLEFFKEHHVLTLATSVGGTPYCANCFYVFLESDNALVFVSDLNTRHAQEAQLNPQVAASVVLETETVGKIQGIQLTGMLEQPQGENLKKAKQAYLKQFPYAVLMKTNFWWLNLEYVKMTDNRLGFGKKLIWEKQPK